MAGRSAAALLHEVVIDRSLEHPSQSFLLSVKLTRRKFNPRAVEDSSYREVWRDHYVNTQYLANLQSGLIPMDGHKAFRLSQTPNKLPSRHLADR
jgi:hypothetical protein